MDFSSRQFTLNKDKVGVTQRMPSGLMNLRYETQPDPVFDDMVARLTAYVLSEHLADDTVTVSREIPVSWWDHFKRDARTWAEEKPCRVLTSWWIRKRPPKFRTVTLTATWTRRATRPQSQIGVHDKLGPVVYQEQVSHHLDW